MRKKLLAVFLMAVMLIVSGAFEVFAESGGEVPNFRALSSYKSVVLRWSAAPDATKYRVTSNGSQIYEGAGFQCAQAVPVDVTNTYKIEALDAEGNVVATSTKTGEAVKTMYYQVTFKKPVKLTSHSGGKYKTKFKAGQVVVCRGFSNGKYIFDYQCRDGVWRTYHAMKIRVKKAKVTHLDPNKTYTNEEAELYVNSRGVNSKTKYMLWVNTYTQKLYIFKGKKGNWTLVQGPWVVSTGRASMPTATGNTAFRRKMKSQHGTPLWNVTDFFSVHGKQKKWKLGWPRSGACVRNSNDHAKWIYKNCKLKTRVHVN